MSRFACGNGIVRWLRRNPGLGPGLGVLGAGLLLLTAGSVVLPARAEESPRPVAKGEAPRVLAGSDLEAGRYLIEIAGCNDCHTPGYAESDGKVPESEWLTGSPVGFHGPWGTTFATNLRLFVQGMEEETWLELCSTRAQRPPMTWPALRHMSDPDRLAILRFVQSLGPAGERMPEPLSPGAIPEGPCFLLDPALAARAFDRSPVQ